MSFPLPVVRSWILTTVGFGLTIGLSLGLGVCIGALAAERGQVDPGTVYLIEMSAPMLAGFACGVAWPWWRRMVRDRFLWWDEGAMGKAMGKIREAEAKVMRLRTWE